MPITIPDLDIDTNIDLDLEPHCQVVLFNDTINTFFWVVESLIKICRHPLEIAQQVAKEAHEHGRSIAYFGQRSECIQIKNQLQERGLTVEVEKI